MSTGQICGKAPNSSYPTGQHHHLLFSILFFKKKKTEAIMNFLIDWYFWTKSLHVISVIAWMAGLFYLPRLYVYHVEEAAKGLALTDTLIVMERRLLKAIMNPAMTATWIFGLALAATPGVVDWSAIWPWAKAASVVGMTVFHMWLAARRKELAAGTNQISGRAYRMMNEVPTILMIIIVFAVIVKF
jgi:protoporphyrinogen IX oxidase